MNASTAIFLDLLVNNELHGNLLRLGGLVLDGDGDVLLHGDLLLVHLHVDLLRLAVCVLGGREGGGFQRSAFYGGLLVNFIFDASFTSECITK